MTDNEKISNWLGLSTFRCTVDGPDCGMCVIDDLDHGITDCNLSESGLTKETCGYWKSICDVESPYTTSDKEAVTLLPTLIERGFRVQLIADDFGYGISVSKNSIEAAWTLQPTFSEAISTVIVQLIDKEMK